jgi:hypothetical protein
MHRRIIPTIGSDHDSIGISVNRGNPMGIQIVDRHSDPYYWVKMLIRTQIRK